MKSLSANSSWISPEFNQGSEEANWSQYTPKAELSYRYIRTGTGTSSTQIVTYDKSLNIQDGDTLLCRMSDGNWEEITVEGVSTGLPSGNVTLSPLSHSGTIFSDKRYTLLGSSHGPGFNQGHFSKDGKRAYAQSANVLYEFELSTPFEFQTGTKTGATIGLAGYSGTGGFSFGNNGRYLYTSSTVQHQVKRYVLSIQYNLSTAVLDQVCSNFNGNRVLSCINGGVWNQEGTRWISFVDEAQIMVYVTSVPWSLHTPAVGSNKWAAPTANPYYASDTRLLLEDGSGFLGVSYYYSQGFYKVNFNTPWDASAYSRNNITTTYSDASRPIFGSINITGLTMGIGTSDGSHYASWDGYSNTNNWTYRHSQWDVELDTPNVLDISTQGLSETPTHVYLYNKPRISVSVGSTSAARERLYLLSATSSAATLGSSELNKLKVGDKVLLNKTTEVTLTSAGRDATQLGRIAPNAVGSNKYIQKKTGFTQYLTSTWKPDRGAPGKFTFSPDGMKIVEGVSGSINYGAHLKVWNLTNPWDISTAEPDPRGVITDQYTVTLDAYTADRYMIMCQFNNDGTKFYWAGSLSYDTTIYEYVCSTPYDLYTMTFNWQAGWRADTVTNYLYSNHIMWSNDGSKLLLTSDYNGGSSDDVKVYTYTAGTNWDLQSTLGSSKIGSSTAVISKAPRSGSEFDNYIGMWKRYNPSGTYLLGFGSGGWSTNDWFDDMSTFAATPNENWTTTLPAIFTKFILDGIPAQAIGQFMTDIYISPDGSRLFIMTDGGTLFETQMRLEPLYRYDIAWNDVGITPTTIWTKGGTEEDAEDLTVVVDSYDTEKIDITATGNSKVIDANVLQFKVQATGVDTNVNTVRIDLKKS
jgi:hypothetical protein